MRDRRPRPHPIPGPNPWGAIPATHLRALDRRQVLDEQQRQARDQEKPRPIQFPVARRRPPG
jgi:hypothetical protein